MEIKVIIENGIVVDVLKNQDTPVNVEIVDVDPDYEDYEALKDYRESLFKDQSLMGCDYTVAHFGEDDEDNDAFRDCDGECLGCGRACADRITGPDGE